MFMSKKVEVENPLYVKDRAAWRSWLADNHAKEKGTWLMFYKKGSGQESVKYEEAVEEALCFGWIDSIMKPGSEQFYYQRFTPRKPKSKWSEINKRRAAKMKRAGLMTPAGLEVIDFELDEIDPDSPVPPPPDLPENIVRALQAQPPAWENLQAMSPYARRIYSNFLTSAKTPETLAKRLDKAIALLKENKKLS
jgi:uncharacterized protein YdeI (YjbR/CyaY-like superfamily)